MLHIAMYSAYRDYHWASFSTKDTSSSVPLIHEEILSHTSLGDTSAYIHSKRHDYVQDDKGKGTVLGYGIY